MWRWLFACGMTAISVSLFVLMGGAAQGHYTPGAITVSWMVSMLVASPTILYYRLLIFVGERSISRRPLAGAALLVIAGATLPPLIHNIFVARRAAQRDFVGPSPRMPDIVAVEEDYNVPPNAMERGMVDCQDTCLRLLYGQGTRRVVIGDPFATAATLPRSRVAPGEPSTYPTAYALHVEHHDVCPEVRTTSDHINTARFPAGLRLSASLERGRHPSLEDRVIALIAAGHCLVAAPGRFLDADLRLGRDLSGPRNLESLAPDHLGLFAGSYSAVDRREGATWSRLSQRMGISGTYEWLYPFAFLPTHHSIFAATTKVIEPASPPNALQPWAWAGVTLPMPPYIGSERVRGLLAAALELPPGAPRDARFRLVRQYIEGLETHPRDPADRALLGRIVADPRIPVADLDALPRILSAQEARDIGHLLIERIRRTAAGSRDIRTLSDQVSRLPREAWPALLPAVLTITTDPQRAGQAPGLFRLYEAGNANDAASLLALFRRDWPPLSTANRRQLTDERRQLFWRASEAREARLVAYLRGLCALVDASPAIRPALVEASQDPAPRPASSASTMALWGTMAAMGIDIERLAAERAVDAGRRQEIARIAREARPQCPSRPASASPPTAANPYPIVGSPSRLAVALDLTTLMALISAAIFATILIARRRRRADQAPAR